MEGGAPAPPQIAGDVVSRSAAAAARPFRGNPVFLAPGRVADSLGHCILMNLRSVLRLSVLVFAVSVAVCLPFLLLGEEVFVPLLDSLKHHTGWLVFGAVLLLGLDAMMPVPSAWVLIFLALHGGVFTGIVGGSLGLCLGVVVSTWVGRVTVGWVAPKFIPPVEIVRLRESMAQHTTLTLACMRSVPVLAETSVMIAAEIGRAHV